MKKKLFAMLLAAAMMFSMTACGEKETADEGEKVLKVGYTLYEPMNYIDDSGELVGFETEFAKAVCEKLGMEAKFVEINWDSKLMELDSWNIDCLWNGMTITPDLQKVLSISDPYIKNYQVVVIRAEDQDKFKTTADLVDKAVDAEAGSAGEAAITGENADANLAQAIYTPVTKQTDALMEVKSKAADAAVLDYVLAAAMVGTGDYSDLMIVPDLELSVEEYGIGFRKGDSALAEEVNGAMKALTEDGTMAKLAEKYGLSDQLLSNQK